MLLPYLITRIVLLVLIPIEMGIYYLLIVISNTFIEKWNEKIYNIIESIFFSYVKNIFHLLVIVFIILFGVGSPEYFSEIYIITGLNGNYDHNRYLLIGSINYKYQNNSKIIISKKGKETTFIINDTDHSIFLKAIYYSYYKPSQLVSYND